MRPIYEFAEFLTSSWRLANPGLPLPSATGVSTWRLRRPFQVVPNGSATF